MALNIKVSGTIHGLVMIYLMGRCLIPNPADSSHSYAKRIFALSLMIIGSLGVLWANIIKAVISRQQKLLADAAAVKLTGNLDGIASALEKISNYYEGSILQSPHAQVNGHLFFGTANAFSFFPELFATHPPLSQRITRLRTGHFKKAGSSTKITQNSKKSSRNNIDKPTILPESLEVAIEKSPMIFIKALYYKQINQLLPDIKEIGEYLELPLLDLTIPHLKPQEKTELAQWLSTVAAEYESWSIREFSIYTVLQYHQYLKQQEANITNLETIWSDSLNLLASVARSTQNKQENINYIFRISASQIAASISLAVPEIPPKCDLFQLYQSIANITCASTELKQTILSACTQIVIANTKKTLKETQLIGAIARALDCPIPPFLQAIYKEQFKQLCS